MAASPRGRSEPAFSTQDERQRAYRQFDLVVAVLLFFLFMGLYHVVTMLTVGDWDFWDDWKDSRWWISFTPVAQIAMPAAVVYIFWARFRLPPVLNPLGDPFALQLAIPRSSFHHDSVLTLNYDR